MAVRNHSRTIALYGISDAISGGAPIPIVANRDPQTNDIAELGTTWVNPLNDGVWVLTSVIANVANWATSPASGVGIFTDVTITGGIGLDVLTLNDGNIVVTNGAVTLSGLLTAGSATINGTTTINGNLAVTGNASVTGDFDITDTGSIGLTSTNNAAGAITLTANGGAAETILIRSLQGTSATSLNLVSTSGGVTLQGGLATADAVNILSGATGGIDIDYGSAGMTITGANGAFTTNSGTGAIGISTDALATVVSVGTGAAAKTVVVGSTTTTSATTIQSGTGDLVMTSTDRATIDAVGVLELNSSGAAIAIGNDADAFAINIGTGAAARIITVGNVTTTTGVVVNSGTGGIALASTTTGDITANSADTLLLDSAGVLELNSSAGVISIGNDAVSQAINIGTGGARVITLGNVTGASQVVLNSGTAGVAINTTGAGDFVVTSADTVLIDAAGVLELNSSAGVIGIGNDAVAQDINIGTGAAARVITVGNVSSTTAVHVNSGTGGIVLASTTTGDIVANSADTLLLDAAGVLELNSSAGAISIGNDAVAQAINVGTGAAARVMIVGNTTAGTTLALNTPTGTSVVAANGVSITTAGRGVTLPGGLVVVTGAGSPNTVVTAAAGSLYLRTDPAGATSRAYINTDGVTAWTNITCAA